MGFLVNPFLQSAVSGDGVAGGRGTTVQNKGTSQFDNSSNASKTVTMASNLTVGNGVVVPLNHYQASSVHPSSVTIAGTAATRVFTGSGTSSRCEVWALNAVVNSGRADVVIAFASGNGHYLEVGAVEVPPLAGVDASGTGSGSSTAPASTSSTPTQCEEFVFGIWRDSSGVNNVNGTPVPAPLTTALFVADGVNSLGGASGFKQIQKNVAQTTTFATTATGWVAGTVTLKLALPLVDVGTSVQFWTASDAWAPTTQSRLISDTTKLLVTVGGWWDGNGTPSAVPTDNNGTFTAALNPTISGESPTTPVITQICYQASPSAATHTVTPPAVQSGGDGYFSLLEISGIDTSTPIRDKGRNRTWHAPVTPPDSNTIQTMTVQTDGALAQVGDIALAVFIMDPNTATNSDVQWVPPSGWFVLENKFNCTDCIGYLLCCAVVTTAGKISATATWTDANTFVADASIVVFKKA